MWLKGFAQVVDMTIANVFYTKIFNDEEEEDGEPFVAPKARGGGGLVEPSFIEAIFEELVDEHASLR